VDDFAARTYLTPRGVVQFLTAGKLVGTRAKDGSWQVSGESLKLPHIQRLLR
jgi:hypothetical protein